MSTTYYKQDDELPTLTDTLGVDLTNASVQLYVEHVASDTLVVNSSATITDATAGDVEYTFADGELDRTGQHVYEWVVTYSSGNVESFPKNENAELDVTRQVNRGGSVSTAVAGRAGPLDVIDFNEQSSAPDSPAADVWALYFDTNGNLKKIDENGTVSTVGGGGGSAITAQEDGSDLTTDLALVDWQDGLTAANPSGDDVTVNVDESEIDHDALQNFDSAEHFTESSISHDGIDQTTVDSDDHHAKYTDEEAQDAVGTILGSLFTYDDATPQITLDEGEISHDGIDQSTVSADDHHAQDQSSNYIDGGSFEIDAAEFAAALGTSGQFLQTDGAAASWATVAFSDLSGSASLAQLSAILDANDDVEAEHLVAGNLPDHASRHQDGGADELDVAELAGALGTSGQVPQSDGAAVSWATLAAADISDVSADSVADAHHAKYTNSDAQSAINNDADHGSTAPHNYFSGNHGDLSGIGEDDHHVRGGFARSDVTSTSVTASAWDSLWVDTGAAGGAVTVTLPADGNTEDGDRVEVGVEDATNNTTVSANTGQSILGSPTTLTTVAETITLEFKASTSTWMIR